MYAGAARTESSAAGAAVATEQRTPKAIRSTADPTRVPRWAIAREQQVLPLIDPRPLQFPGLQAKLRISQPGDDYEKEADQTADRIADAMARANGGSADLADPDDLASDELAGDDLDEVEGTEVAAPAGETVIQRKRRSANASHPRPYRSGSVALQRQTTGKDSSSEPAEDIRGDLLTIAEGAEEEELEEDVSVPAEGGLTGTLMRSERNDGERPVTGDRGALLNRTLTAPGEPLGESIRAPLEAGFGRNLGPVRVHTDADAAASAEAVNARAVHRATSRRLRRRRVQALRVPDGLRLLAHELTHVLQQTSAAGQGAGSGRGTRRVEHRVAARGRRARAGRRLTGIRSVRLSSRRAIHLKM